MQTTTAHKIDSIRWVSDAAFVLRFDRRDLPFAPGQYLSVGPSGEINMREYSVYSAPSEEFLEILVKVVDGGYVSRRLAELTPGDPIAVDGPFGYFTVDDDWRDHRYVFIATGTGISPFHCFAGAYPGMDYQLLHGVRTSAERYDHEVFERTRIVTCITGDNSSDYHGRVTGYLRDLRDQESGINTAARYYLCGNCDMIYEAFDILQDAGVPHNQLFAEVYF